MDQDISEVQAENKQQMVICQNSNIYLFLIVLFYIYLYNLGMKGTLILNEFLHYLYLSRL